MIAEVRCGIAGWSYPDWENVVYPARKPRGFSRLAYLADYIDAMEVNVTFYRPIPAATAEKWVKEVATRKDFLFTAKLLNRFTHERTLPWTAQEAETVKAGMRPLAEAGRFGALLMQFPWSFKESTESRDHLLRLRDEFSEFPSVVEVRHASWETEESQEFFRRERLNFCNIDQPQIGASIGMTNVATGPIAYYRFHGRNYKAWFAEDRNRDQRYNYLYSPGELAPWVDNIMSMAQRVQRIYVMNNNHYQGQALVNALQLKAALSNEKVAVPHILRDHYPVLNDIAQPQSEQGEMF